MKSQRQFLVICRVGDKSLHPEWLSGTHRNFDIYVSYFGDTPGRYRDESDYYEEVKGPKWPIIDKIVKGNPELISQYDAIWVPDDDLAIETSQINRMFNLFAGFGFDLAQPALTADSHVIYKELIACPDALVRYVNFVEIMAPIFSQRCFNQLKHTFSQSASGWGLDYLWPLLLNYKNIGVIDCTPVIHTRPLGGELYKNNAMSPRDDILKVADQYPEFNISPQHKPNKFRIYSTIRVKLRAPYWARVAARIQKKLNKKRYECTARYGA